MRKKRQENALTPALSKTHLHTQQQVNIRFAHPRSVEFTDEVALFDLAGVGLVHGWVMGPGEPEAGLLGTGAAYNATAALAVEAAGGGSGGLDGGAPAPPPPALPPPARSLLDEDWPPGAAPTTTTATPAQPSAPCLPTGLEPVPSADLADALEAKVGLGDRRRTASSTGGENGAVSALVAAALAKAVAAAEARPGPATTTTTTTTTTTSSPSRAAKAAAAASWLARTATQLTPAGLVALHDPAAGGLTPGELAAFFRGSHFAVAYARPRPADPLPPGDVGGGVFTLVTDVGYRGRGVAWERLDSVDGDTTLVGPDFCPPRAAAGGEGEEGEEGGRQAAAGTAPAGADHEDADLALAMRLQAEEDAAARAAAERARAAAAAQQQQQAQQQAQQQQQRPPLRRPGSGLLGFGSGRTQGSGGSGQAAAAADKCCVM
jgi:hypothetical protein